MRSATTTTCHYYPPVSISDDGKEGGGAVEAAAMGVMGKLKIFVVKEPVVAASCLIAGFGTRPLSSLWYTRTPVDG
jgi:hypothetical protein